MYIKIAMVLYYDENVQYFISLTCSFIISKFYKAKKKRKKKEIDRSTINFIFLHIMLQKVQIFQFDCHSR